MINYLYIMLCVTYLTEKEENQRKNVCTQWKAKIS